MSHGGMGFSFLELLRSVTRVRIMVINGVSRAFRCVTSVNGASGCAEGANGSLGGWKTNSTVRSAVLFLVDVDESNALVLCETSTDEGIMRT